MKQKRGRRGWSKRSSRPTYRKRRVAQKDAFLNAKERKDPGSEKNTGPVQSTRKKDMLQIRKSRPSRIG